ncbi:hypothetical protein J2Z66_006604 [Paenibacillus eucommiae]|uniref:Uncharacterized protein n=1 Tax=Paenibacillus eucommiae TaxID=1355755 RepID=A0ABS4J596_9BACL|nr:hypothetical protein [Paenibacillus eucommiae]
MNTLIKGRQKAFFLWQLMADIGEKSGKLGLNSETVYYTLGDMNHGNDTEAESAHPD